MVHIRFAIALTLALLTACHTARAQQAEAPAPPPAAAAPLPNETVVRIPVTVPTRGGSTATGDMVVTIVRPDGPGPFPIVVMSHGRSAALEKRRETPRFRYPGLSRYFVRRGFAVLMPTRLGYGDSGVEVDPEATARLCDDRDFEDPARAITAEILTTIAFAGRQPWADAKRVVVAGQSYGGFGSVAALTALKNQPLAVINFAGGAGGDPDHNPGAPCHPDRIARIYAGAGRSSTVPTLWLYAKNDRYWGADNPVSWHQAFRTAGGRGELAMMPPVGTDGHNLLAEGFALWRPRVDAFLGEIGIPAPHTANAPPPSGFAALDDHSRLPFLKEQDKTTGYGAFLKADVPRAFAVSPSGAWGWRSGDAAMETALQNCNARASKPCVLYAVDDAVVWRGPGVATAGKAGPAGVTAGRADPAGTGNPGKRENTR